MHEHGSHHRLGHSYGSYGSGHLYGSRYGHHADIYYPSYIGYGAYYPYYGGYGSYYYPYANSATYTYAPVYIDQTDDDVLEYNEPDAANTADDDLNNVLGRFPVNEEPPDLQGAGRPPAAGRSTPSIPDDLAPLRPLIEPDEPPEVLPPLPDADSGESSDDTEDVADPPAVQASQPPSSPSGLPDSKTPIGSP